ncbi:MAG: hypothetical protein ACREBW_10465 [Candidatus Micrarchaeaceae archaeon]
MVVVAEENLIQRQNPDLTFARMALDSLPRLGSSEELPKTLEMVFGHHDIERITAEALAGLPKDKMELVLTSSHE